MQAEATFDIEKIRQDFPILSTQPHGKPLVYMDNGASAQKPKQVIDAISNFYAYGYANIHRGVHSLSQDATEAHDSARKRVAQFLNAPNADEVIFVKGATEGFNLVASCYAMQHVEKGDNIVISEMEHHANIVPWQFVTEAKEAELRVVPIDDHGILDEKKYEGLVDERTKIVSLTLVSNALGTINPIKRLIPIAHAVGAKFMVDAAQAAPHMKPDVQHLDCDFLTFSGHKTYGPTGIGVLWGRQELLDSMPPYQGGGDMISHVTFEKTTYKEAPERFEAGTPHIAGAIGLAVALDYMESIGFDAIQRREKELLEYANKRLVEVPGMQIIGTAPKKACVISFKVEGIHPHDIGTFLDEAGVAVRTGHHCAEPLMKRFNLPGTTRASLCFYNTKEEIDVLVNTLIRIQKFFA